MHGIPDYKDPLACFSPKVVDFIENGISWESADEMQRSMTLEEKGWRVKVKWGQQYEGEQCIGLGVFADEDIPSGTIVRIGRIGVNQVVFNKNINLPTTKNKKTVVYVKDYAGRCPCQNKENPDNLLVWLPGSSWNHSENNSNIKYNCLKAGIDMVASRDIRKDEAITGDYRTMGFSPDWYKEWLKEELGDSENVFQGCNDFVKQVG